MKRADPLQHAAVVIGGSAGALEALDTVLPLLPASYPLPLALVLHMLPGKPSLLAQVLREVCAMVVKEAEDKEQIAPGTLYLASPGYHLLVERRRCFSLSVDDPVLFSRPSIDVLFESAAEAYGPGLVGVLLSGANDDGVRGLSRIRRAGGVTIVQAPETAASRQMPEAAIKAGQADRVVPLAELGPLLASLGRAVHAMAPEVSG